MNRSQKNSVRYRARHFRITTTGVREGQLGAEVVNERTLLLSSPDGQRELAVPALSEDSVHYHSDLPVLNAAYAMAVRDVWSCCNEAGLLTAGASWNTVWTRDIAFAMALGADFVAHDACRRTLVSRVRNGVIIQDTGTGGGWPVSTDRVSWAMGAWASYLSGGGNDWLNYCINTIKATLDQDASVLHCTPLVPGETSFLDWREQSYPAGMSPAQIGETFALSTNVLHYICRRILARMLREASRNDEAAGVDRAADELGKAINAQFHRVNSSKYVMFLTADGLRDSHIDALGSALAVLSGLAGDEASRVLQSLGRTAYGTPVFSPFKPELKEVYHNSAIWPFVEAFVMLAHVNQRNAGGVEFSAMCMLRSALLNATNKENFHARTGRAEDTVSNSDAQLWSAAGMLALFYHGVLGLRIDAETLTFAPCIPRSLSGTHCFSGLKVRDMTLNVRVTGHGAQLASVLINGQPSAPSIPLSSHGHFDIVLQLESSAKEQGAPGAQVNPSARNGLATPTWCEDATPSVLHWHPVPGASRYVISYNGKTIRRVTKTTFHASYGPRIHYRAYRVQALGDGKSSALSLPLEYIAPGSRTISHPERIGDGSVSYTVERAQAWLDTRPCTSITTYGKVSLPAGSYGVRVCYCNATASLRDSDTCALRELWIDGRFFGVLVMPHNTEAGCWENYSLTAMLECQLPAGVHEFSLRYTPRCANMNGEINQCMVRQLEIIRLH